MRMMSLSRRFRDKCTAHGNVIAELVARNNFLESASVPLIRRSYLDAIGGYDPSLAIGSEDWKLNLALADICEFAVVPVHLVGYRQSDSNMSKNTTAMEQSIDVVERWIVDKWPDLPAKVKRQMVYHSNDYLAHRALSTNDFPRAARYLLRSSENRPIWIAEFGYSHLRNSLSSAVAGDKEGRHAVTGTFDSVQRFPACAAIGGCFYDRAIIW